MTTVGVAVLLAVPALLDGRDRAAALSDVATDVDRRPSGVTGLRRRAQRLLADRRYAGAAADARGVLARAPLDRGALRILAMAEQARGNEEFAGELLADASFVTWHDPYTQLQLLGLALRVEDWSAAARRADALSRLPTFRDEGFAGLADLLATGHGLGPVAERLSTRPPWRAPFLEWLSTRPGATAGRVLPLLSALSQTAAPATDLEVAPVMHRLIAAGAGEDAYAFWRKRHPTAGLVPDPELLAVRTGPSRATISPFVWSVAPDAVLGAVTDRGSDGRQGFTVEPTGDRSDSFISVHTLAAPGRYAFAYTASGSPDQLDRLHPDLACLRAGRLSLEPSASTMTAAGRRSRYVTTIPRDCGLLVLAFTFESAFDATPSPVAIRSVAFAPAR